MEKQNKRFYYEKKRSLNLFLSEDDIDNKFRKTITDAFLN